MLTTDRLVTFNKTVHDQVAATYDIAHTEIFNVTEQSRLFGALQYAVSQIATGAHAPLVLDYGAGTGNLTRHLLKLGARVIAGDVSKKSLEVVDRALGSTGRLQVVELNGVDLSKFDDNSVDMVATYSVLHHVPDYVAAVREFARVVRPGGIIYIDHECCPGYWGGGTEEYQAYEKALNVAQREPVRAVLVRKLRNVVSLRAWRRLALRRFWGLNDEGDIHVTEADHIEWDKIQQIIEDNGETLRCEDYLVCRESGSMPIVHQRFCGSCSDMRLVICRMT